MTDKEREEVKKLLKKLNAKEQLTFLEFLHQLKKVSEIKEDSHTA